MKLALREGMTPGRTLREQLEWLERIGIEGIELHGPSLDLPPDELLSTFAHSPVRAANLAGSSALLHPEPQEREAAKELTRQRLRLAGMLGSAGVLLVPQFGPVPQLPDLSPTRLPLNWRGSCSSCSWRSWCPRPGSRGCPSSSNHSTGTKRTW